MAYDIYTPISTPVVPVNMYAEAAKAGAQVGNMIPTTTTAIIQGAIQGYGQGQEIRANEQRIEAQAQENEIRQNQIEQLPVTNEMQQLQLENAKKVNAINAMKLKLEQETETYNLDIAKAKAENELLTFQTKKKIAETLAGDNPKSVLEDPQMSQVMFEDSKYATNVLGALANKGVLSEDEKQKLFERADFVRAQELKAQEEIARERSRTKAVEQLDKVADKMTNSADVINSLSAAGIDNPEDLWRRDVQIVRSGQKTYKKDSKGETTNQVDTSVPDKYGSDQEAKPATYDVIIDGVRSPQVLYSKEDAALVNSYVKLGRERYGISPTKTTTAQVAPAQAPKEEKNWWERTFGSSTPATPPRTAEQINQSLAQQGIPPERAAPILAEAKQRGADMNMMQRIVSGIIPDFLEENPAANSAVKEFEESGAAKDTRALVDELAPQMAEKKMEELKAGSSEVKRSLRDWADENGVKLTKSGLTQYYANRLRTELGQAYKDSMTIGVAEKAQAVRNQTAVDAAKARLKGKTPDEIIKGAQAKEALGKSSVPDFVFDASVIGQEETPVVDIDAKVKDIQGRYQLPDKVADRLKTTAAKVEANPHLKVQPPDVKAVAAVESAGQNAAVSKTGVKGIMQVTKRTAAHLNARHGTNHNRLTPEGSVALGRLYIEDLKKMFPGSAALAYAAYNAGPGVIKYAQQLAGGSTSWEEIKPFLLSALTFFQSKEGWRPVEKLAELRTYPERVALYEELFGGSSSNG